MKRNTRIIVIACVAFAAALGLTLWPLISTAYNNSHQSQIHTQYNQEIAQAEDAIKAESKLQADRYNATLVQGIQEVDAFSNSAVEQASQDYADLLNLAGNGIMGYLQIPKLQVEQPIYHGTADATLEVGVGHLLGSSLPVGGDTTHCVLTGHSGMASNKMLSDLEQLQPGDVFFLEVLGQTLAYQVDQINTVLPHDTSYLGIEEGQDYCTLVTCTPFGVNTHRLLVRGTRVPYSEEEKVEIIAAQEEEGTASTWEQQYIRGIMLGIGLAALMCVGLVIVSKLRRRGGKGKYES